MRLETVMKPNRASVVGGQNAASAAQNSGWKNVAGYRLYCLDGASKVSSAEWIDAEDDNAAIKVAETMFDGYECELWQGTRLIARLDLRQRG